MARSAADEVAVVGVASRDDLAAMEEFVARHGLGDVPQIADLEGVLWGRLGVVGQPAWIFVDSETGAVTRHLGFLDAAALTERLSALAG